MTSLLRTAALLAVALLATTMLTPRQALAQGPCYGGYGGGVPYLPGLGQSILPYTLGHVPVPPYFALHPPVYYSVPVPRTYGHSPFAYPGTYRTPDIEIIEPEEIVNPHVEPTSRPLQAETEAKTALFVAPETIYNPFVDQPHRNAGDKLATIITPESAR